MGRGPLPILLENLGKRPAEWAAGRLQPEPNSNASRPSRQSVRV